MVPAAWAMVAPAGRGTKAPRKNDFAYRGADPLVRGRRPRRPDCVLPEAHRIVRAAGRGRPVAQRAPPRGPPHNSCRVPASVKACDIQCEVIFALALRVAGSDCGAANLQPPAGAKTLRLRVKGPPGRAAARQDCLPHGLVAQTLSPPSPRTLRRLRLSRATRRRKQIGITRNGVRAS